MLILPVTNLDGGLAVAEKLRMAVEALTRPSCKAATGW